MAPRESFSVSEPPKLVFCSISGWGWHFVDQKLESAYSEELLKKVYVQMQRLNRVYWIVGCLAFGCFSLHGLSTVPWSTASEAYRACGGDTLVRAFGPFFGYHVALHMAPKSMPEQLCCGLTFIFQMLVLLCNPLRLRRFNFQVPIDDGINASWLKSCDPDLVESARDSLRVGVVLVNDVCFNASVPIRSKVSLYKLLLSIACSSVVFIPVLRPDDGAITLVNYIILVWGLCVNSYFRFDNERQHREIWRLEKKAKEEEKARAEAERAKEAEAKALLELLYLICPVVVLVRDGQITQSNAFTEYFGVSVSTIFDLQIVQEKGSPGSPDDHLERMVREAQTGKLPTKRGVTIRPVGGMTMFRCTACAVFAESREGVYLGFQIEEQWTTVAVEPALSERSEEERFETPRTPEGGRSLRDNVRTEEMSPCSVNANLYSSLEEYGSSFARMKLAVSKRVCFETQTDNYSECSSNSSRRNLLDLCKCQIASSALRIQDDDDIAVAFQENRPVRATLHTARVYVFSNLYSNFLFYKL
jgi:hypothetical protein